MDSDLVVLFLRLIFLTLSFQFLTFYSAGNDTASLKMVLIFSRLFCGQGFVEVAARLV